MELRQRENAERLSTAQAMKLVDSLKKAGKSCLIHNTRVRRAEAPVRWILSVGEELAPAYDDDTDEEWNTHR